MLRHLQPAIIFISTRDNTHQTPVRVKHLLAHELTHTIQQGASGNRIQRDKKKERFDHTTCEPFRLTKTLLNEYATDRKWVQIVISTGQLYTSWDWADENNAIGFNIGTNLPGYYENSNYDYLRKEAIPAIERDANYVYQKGEECANLLHKATLNGSFEMAARSLSAAFLKTRREFHITKRLNKKVISKINRTKTVVKDLLGRQFGARSEKADVKTTLLWRLLSRLNSEEEFLLSAQDKLDEDILLGDYQESNAFSVESFTDIFDQVKSLSILIPTSIGHGLEMMGALKTVTRVYDLIPVKGGKKRKLSDDLGPYR